MFKYKLRLIILATSILTASPASKIHAASDLECYATLKNDVLTIGNNHIRRDFQWNKGDLKTISIIDKSRDDKLVMRDRRSDIGLGKAAGKVRSGQWTKKVVASAITNPHLQAEVTATYEYLDVRRVFRIYPDCAKYFWG